MGVVEGNKPVSDNDWEKITNGGDKAIQAWIHNQLSGKSVAIVLIGTKTAGRKWIKYEIKKAWNEGKGVFGIYIHNLKDGEGEQSAKGSNPFEAYNIGETTMSKIVKTYDPPYSTSTYVYDHIKENLPGWIEKAIEIRGDYD